MEGEDGIDLPGPGDTGSEIENKELCDTNFDATEPDVRQDQEDIVGDVENIDKNLGDNPAMMEVSISLTETVTVEEKLDSFSPKVDTENGCLTARDENMIGNRKIDDSPITGVKRARMTFDEQKPLVRVIYNSLTRESKRKLEEQIQKWSEWDAQHCSSTRDQTEVLESGEDTYYPALYVGLDKPSTVSFWMENQTRNSQNKELNSMDCDSVPHYDRGYALGLTSLDGPNNLEGGLDLIDASRCFNCGSYNHSLKQCPKPRNNAAVNNARKQQKSRRNQNAGTRNPTRYYQNSSGGKYDGLRPGALDAETRQLLGLGELDPPPWLNRMREIGYPPGYLDPEDEDQPSGITIFGDEEDNNKVEQEDGEILETDYPEPQKKMSVEFPGINVPIPENADERRWAAGASNSEPYWNRSHRRFNHPSEQYGREQYREQRWSQNVRDDGPPGCDPVVGPSSSYPPSYGNYDSSYSYHSSRGNIQTPRSPSSGRSLTDRGRRSPLDRDGSPDHGSYSSASYLSSTRRPSSRNYGSSSFENLAEESRKESNPDHSSYSREKHSSHHYRGRR